jgi:Secretion system C-terminal sorting domain
MPELRSGEQVLWSTMRLPVITLLYIQRTEDIMSTKEKRHFLSIVAIAGMLLGSIAVYAQEFENMYGSTTCRETGTGGVQPVSTGGYISAGSSHISVLCATADIFVVKTNNNGTLSWSNTYDLGGNDTATDIQECANGDFIVVGNTTNPTGCNQFSIFLLRLSPTGAVIWAKTYGRSNAHGDAFDVQELTIAPGGATSVGDFIVCGIADSTGAGLRAYLMRTSSVGNLIWDAKYFFTIGGSRFYSVDESTVGMNAGDIIAAGFAGPEAIIVRVDGSSGAIGASPQGAGRFGGRNIAGVSTIADILRSVRELKIGANAGNIIAVGQTRVKANGDDIYVTKIGPDPCGGVLVDRIIGDNSGISNDTAFGVREMSSGDLILTGSSDFRGAALKTDAFLTEIDPNTLAQAGFGIRFYGDSSYERGYSVAEVAAALPQTSAGFIFCGFTQSKNIIGVNDPQQMYLVKVDATGTTSCNYSPMIRDSVPDYPDSCLVATIIHPDYPVCSVTTDSVQRWTVSQRCTDLDGTCGCVTRKGGPNNSNDGAAGVGTEDVLELAEGVLTSYPNPVRRGSSLYLGYRLAVNGNVAVSISDVAGNVVHSTSTSFAEGHVQIPVSTEGWSSGTYIIRVESNGGSATRRILVVD